MGSGVPRILRASLSTLGVLAFTVAVAGASQSNDAAVAQAGVFVASDFPAGFEPAALSITNRADQMAAAKSIDGCGPYLSVQRRLTATTEADSSQFGDGSRSYGNKVAVFPSDKGAGALLALDAKPSMVACLEKVVEKQLRQSKIGSGAEDVDVSLERQDIAGLGDDSVVYEGTAEIAAADGTTQRVGVGNAMVRVGPVIDAVTYSGTGPRFVDDLTPAIDASVGRVRAALARSA